ncbi:MAG: hypothetical protein AB1668_02060 [Nanoarchaeota archaeon]
MKKTILKAILILFSLLVISLFLVSCAPQITDDELKTELSKLTPEERAELLADLEAKESGAVAGQAFKAKITEKRYYGKVSPKVFEASPKQIGPVVDILKTPSGAAAVFCSKPENEDEYTHYCSETDTEIKYDKFKCVKYEKGIFPVHKIDTAYPKNKLYPQVDTCKEILATFLDKPDAAIIGCYDSDGKESINSIYKTGYIEVYQIDTGNKAKGGSGKAPIKEVDVCAGVNIKAGTYDGKGWFNDGTGKGWHYLGEGWDWLTGEVTEGCSAGYYDEGIPPSGYIPSMEEHEENVCRFKWRATSNDKVWAAEVTGTKLFERTCPPLFSTQAEGMTTVIDNCPYVTGYDCYGGRCDDNGILAAYRFLGKSLPDEPCKGLEKCKKAAYLYLFRTASKN